MRSLIVVCISLCTLLLLMLMPAAAVQAQDNKAANDSLFQLVQNDINEQNGDALYALLNADFKAQFTKDQFTGVLTSAMYPLGKITDTKLLGYADGTSSYKTVCEQATIKFNIRADKDGRIAGLRFMQYKEPVATKSFTPATDNKMRTATDTAVDKIARDYISKLNTVGLSIGIYKDGKTVTYGYGTTIKDKEIIPSTDAVFEIGSVSKTFTSTLLAFYTERRKVSLTDPITKYLPDSVAMNTALQQITLQMLANHTSGLPRLPDNIFSNKTDMMDPYKGYSKEQLYTYLKNCKLASVPGEKYNYSNLAAGLLGVILEKVSGKLYEQMMKEVICKPLHMDNTFIHPDTKQQAMQVNVYDERTQPAIMWDLSVLAGAGGVRSTTADMMKYVVANLKPENTLSKAMALTHIITYSKEMNVGLGWHNTDIAGSSCYWHNGATGGSRSYVGFIQDKNIAVVVLANTAADVDEAGVDLLKALQ